MKFHVGLMVSVACLVCFSVGVSKAQDQTDQGVVYQKKTVYNFEDDTITGDLTRPDQEFLTGRKRARHKSLIRIREDFKERVLKSVKDL